MLRTFVNRFSRLLLAFILLTSYIHPVTTFAYQTNMNASVVIGQADFTHGSLNQGGSVSALSLADPTFVATDGTKLIVSDSSNHRVLIYNHIPTSNNTPADVVIGQADFTHNSANQGGSVSANGLSTPRGIILAAGKIILADQVNNRVLIWNSVPTSNNTPADVVIGQTSMSANTTGCAADKLIPNGVAYDGQSGKLLIHDGDNGTTINRILIFNRIPTTNGASADVVLGQTDFTSCVAKVSPTATSMDSYGNPIVAQGKLIVTHNNVGHRVTIYNSIPTTNNAPADVVIGQPDMTSGGVHQGGSPGANTMDKPTGVTFDGTRLFIADQSNRLLIFNGIPTSNNASAYMVLGQASFSGVTANQGGTVSANSLSRTYGLTQARNKLIVVDRSNHRVLIYNNTEDVPGLTLSNTITSGNNGKLRFNGTTSTTSTSTYTPTAVDYSVNKGSYQSATPKDGSWDSVREDYYFDFSPSDNNYKGEGYTVKVRTRNSNLDQTDNAFFFQPFSLNLPVNNGSSSTGLPTFSYNVNKDLFSELKENLSKFQVQTRRNGEGWRTYIDNIPVSYLNVKDNPDNTNPTKGTDGKGNGTYESKKLTIVYSNDNATISVTPKSVDSDGNLTTKLFPENSQRLASGVYEWKVVAVDKVGHTQETDTRMLKVSGTLTTGAGTSGVYFPLSLLSFSTSSIDNISTNYPQGIKSSYTAYTTVPTLKGIAFANSTITLNTTDTSCTTVLNPNDPNCMKTQTAVTGADSRFSMTVPAKTLLFGKKYTTSLSVAKDGQFNALPDFTLSVIASQQTGTTVAPTLKAKK